MEDIASMHGLGNSGLVKHKSTQSSPALQGTETGAVTPPAVQHQQPESSLQRTHSLSSAHSRSASNGAAGPGARKRLSLSFPVLPPGSTLSPRNVSPSHSPSSICSSPRVDLSQITPDDSMAFLTALAAQERRVLELKEELGKAETELGKLKKQWAAHEATRKRHEISPLDGLRLNTDLLSRQERRGQLEQMISPDREEMRRKAALGNRKILPSQRHQRMLSLLSPNRLQYQQSNENHGSSSTSSDTNSFKPPPLTKRHTLSSPPSSIYSISPPSSRPQSLCELSLPTPKRHSQEALLRTGKELVDDLREGLWTFIEDLRQATVGDEGIHSSVNSTGIRASPNTSTNNLSQTIKSQTNKTNTSSAGKTDVATVVVAAMQQASLKKGKEVRKATEESLIDFEEVDTKVQDRKPSKENRRNMEAGSESGGRKSARPQQQQRWSTGSILSDIPGEGCVTPPSTSSTPRTSTSSTISNAGTAVTTNNNKKNNSIINNNSNSINSNILAPAPTPTQLQSPLWSSVRSSTQFHIKKTASVLIGHVEKSLAPPISPRRPGSSSSSSTTGYGIGQMRSIEPVQKSKKS